MTSKTAKIMNGDITLEALQIIRDIYAKYLIWSDLFNKKSFNSCKYFKHLKSAGQMSPTRFFVSATFLGESKHAASESFMSHASAVVRPRPTIRLNLTNVCCDSSA